MFDLLVLSDDELRALHARVQEILAEREAEAEGEFAFDFNVTNRKDLGMPYVARLVWGTDRDYGLPTWPEVDREFFPMLRIDHDGLVKVSGTYRAKPGWVLEIRTGGSWIDGREWYVVTTDGQLRLVARMDDLAAVDNVMRYLRGEQKEI